MHNAMQTIHDIGLELLEHFLSPHIWLCSTIISFPNSKEKYAILIEKVIEAVETLLVEQDKIFF